MNKLDPSGPVGQKRVMSTPYRDLSYATHLLSVSGRRSWPEIAVKVLPQILQTEEQFRAMKVTRLCVNMLDTSVEMSSRE